MPFHQSPGGGTAGLIGVREVYQVLQSAASVAESAAGASATPEPGTTTSLVNGVHAGGACPVVLTGVRIEGASGAGLLASEGKSVEAEKEAARTLERAERQEVVSMQFKARLALAQTE